jgi:hypothetical protein
MKRRDLIASHLESKQVLTDILSAFTWIGLSGLLFATAIKHTQSGSFIFGVLMVVFCSIFIALSMIYVALYIALPLDNAMYPDDPYWNEKRKKMNGVAKLYETLKIFLSRRGAIYLLLTTGYLCCSLLVVTTYI